MSKRRQSAGAAAEEGAGGGGGSGGGGAGTKLARLSGAREEAVLAGLESAWAAAARAQVDALRGAPDTRVALARYLDGLKSSLFTGVRASRAAAAAAAAGAPAAEAVEPVDRELAQEVARLEKAVEKLGKTVKEAREHVRGLK
jgi:hypothetical protein